MFTILLLICTVVLGGLLAVTIFYWKECCEVVDGYPQEWFRRWLLRGVVTPLVLWVGMTWFIGRFRAYSMPMYGRALQIEATALPIVSFWAAVTFAWLLGSVFKRARNKDDVVIALIVWEPVLLPVFWTAWKLSGWAGTGIGVVLWIWPLTHYVLSVVDVKEPPPAYSKAIGKIKFGKYGEAEMAIIGELEKCDSDFDGWMMLAALYANQFHDLKEAEKTIYDLCAEPSTTLSQVSIALHKLADWHLNLCGNPVAARRVLEEICARMPGTHLGMMAQRRIQQLPRSHEEYAEQHKAHTVAMPALNESLNEPAADAAPVDRDAALAAANQFVERLNRDPNDVASREKLAKIFAEQLGQVDLALEQLELLIQMPGQPPGKVAEWLALTAAWLIRQRGEGDAAKQILERIIREFPQSAQAFAAQRRLTLMKMNAKMQARQTEAKE